MTLAQYRKSRPEGDAAVAEAHEPGGHAHPGPTEYIVIGLILAFITAVEVALYYVDMSLTTLVVLMLPLSWAKFALVVLWFMHLRFDNPLFRQLFFGGLLLTVVIFAIAMATIGGTLV
jgi:cytochrome c oxidase subunit 4